MTRISPHELTIVVSAAQGVPIEDLDLSGVGADARNLLTSMGHANGHGRVAVLTEALRDDVEGQAILRAVFAAEESPVTRPWLAKVGGCPPLPEQARLDPQLGRGRGLWLDHYNRYAESISPMTPHAFHESAGLWLAAVAIARRVKLPMAFGDVFPNLFIVWIAQTTVFHKTTALEAGRRVARAVIPHLLAPQETSPEAFLADLAGHEPPRFDDLSDEEKAEWREERNFAAQRGLLLDEMSGLLAGAGRDYNAGLIEAFLRFYDCDPKYSRSTRGQGRVTVRNAALSFLGASTPKALAPHLTSDRLWAMGWWSRCALLCPEGGRPEWQKPTATWEYPPPDLVQQLRHLHNRLPRPAWPNAVPCLSISLGKGVFEHWDFYNRIMSHDLLTDELDERLWGTYGRLPTQVLKVASILAALDWSDSQAAPRIELGHLARAIEIAEQWRASAHRVLHEVTISEDNNKLLRLLRQIGRYGQTGATLRDLSQNMRDLDPDKLVKLLETAVVTGDVVAVEALPGHKGGRPTQRFRLPAD